MATHAAMVYRIAEAIKRQKAGSAVLVETDGIPPLNPRRVRDAQMQRVFDHEAIADFIEALAAKRLADREAERNADNG